MLSGTRNFPVFSIVFLLSFIFSGLVSSAFVQSYSCEDDLRPLSVQEKKIINNPITSVMKRDNHIFYILDFLTTTEINDVNYTTNLYTTLNINSRFMSGEVLDTSVRLCQYARLANTSDPYAEEFLPDLPVGQLIDSSSNTTDTPVPWPSASNIPPLISKRENVPNVCPLEPGHTYRIIFATNISSSRYFGSFETKFNFLSANRTSNNRIGCFQVYPTLYHPTYITYTVCFGVMAIFIVGFFTNFYIFMFSPHQESDNVFLTIASSICNAPLLNELTPDVTILLNFLQFVLFACALDLNYPGFLQPIVSYLNWVALIRIDIFSSEFVNALSDHGVYKTLGRKGIYGIFPDPHKIPSGETTSKIWKNFTVWSWCIVAFLILLTQSFVFYKQHRNNSKIFGLKSKLYFAFGPVTQFFYVIFPLPFVSISCFLILGFCTKPSSVEVASFVFCVILFIIWLLGITLFSVKYVILKRNKLYSSFKIIACWSSLYHWYKPDCSFFLIIKKVIVLVQGIVIGCGQHNGTVQVSLLMFIEIVHILLLLYFQPYFNKTRNVWSIFLSIASLVIVSINIAYIRDLYVPTYIRGVLGDIQLLICCAITLIFFIFFILRTTQVFRLRLKKGEIDSKLVENSHSGEKFSDTEDSTDTTLRLEEKRQDSPEFEFEERSDHLYHNFPRPRLHTQVSRQESIRSENSSIVELTDQRALPGISLSYLHSKEHLPAPVSPIDDEFLANLSKDDSELRKLWAKRNNYTRISRFDTESSFEITLSSKKGNNLIDESTSDKKGFQVVGRKPIIVKDGGKSNSSATNSEDKKKRFVVVGRKPIVVNHEAKLLSSEEDLTK